MLQVVIACRCDVWIGTFFTYTTKVEGNCIYAANKSNVGNMPFFKKFIVWVKMWVREDHALLQTET